MQTGMRSLTAALLLLALLAPLACQASSQGRELKQDLSSITNLASGSGLGNIAGGSGFNAGSITSALSGLAGGGGGFTNLASNIGGGSGGLGNIVSAVSSVGGRKMLSN